MEPRAMWQDVAESTALIETILHSRISPEDCIIRAMPTIDSDGCRPPVLSHVDHPFRWDGVQFSRDAGIGGRLDSESVDGMLRNPEKKN